MEIWYLKQVLLPLFCIEEKKFVFFFAAVMNSQTVLTHMGQKNITKQNE